MMYDSKINQRIVGVRFESHKLGDPIPPPTPSPEACWWLGKGPGTAAKEGGSGIPEMGFPATSPPVEPFSSCPSTGGMEWGIAC